MSEPVVLQDVNCRGCGRRVGISSDPSRCRIFCSALCAEDFPVVSDKELRDSVMEAYVRQTGKWAKAVADIFSITRQRADQILRARKV